MNLWTCKSEDSFWQASHIKRCIIIVIQILHISLLKENNWFMQTVLYPRWVFICDGYGSFFHSWTACLFVLQIPDAASPQRWHRSLSEMKSSSAKFGRNFIKDLNMILGFMGAGQSNQQVATETRESSCFFNRCYSDLSSILVCLTWTQCKFNFLSKKMCPKSHIFASIYRQ